MKEVLEIFRRAREGGVTAGKTPQAVAGTCAYLAAARVGSPVSQEVAARAAGTTATSVRNLAKEIRKAGRKSLWCSTAVPSSRAGG
ncbi:MAG: hypothetical protein QXM93_06595 [Candidatus Methanomethyliaceae archaeon]